MRNDLQSNPGWAADYDHDKIINCLNPFKYLNYDPELDFESPLDIIASEYCDAVLMEAGYAMEGQNFV